MKRLLLLYQWQGGGIPEVLFQLAKAGLFSGYDVTQCIAEPLDEDRRERFSTVGKIIEKRSRFPAFLLSMRKALAGSDIVHVNSLKMLLLQALVGAWEVPTLFQIHGEYDYFRCNTLIDKLKYSLFYLACKRLSVRAVLTVNAHIPEMIGNLKIPVTVIENGILPRHRPVDTVSSEVPVVIGMGRLDPEKRFDRFIDIALLVNKKSRVEFHIYGAGILKQDLQDRIDGADLHGVVQLKGYTPDPLTAISLADVLLCTSSREGSPLVFAEALSVGIPIVTFPVGTARYMFDREPVFKVGESIGQLADQILELVNADESARREHKKRCVYLFNKHFNAEKKVEQYKELYHLVQR
jgi:glycosyltransferase involved in cell wall biosynthesis